MLLPPAVIVVRSWLRERGFNPEIKFLAASARTASDAADALNVPLSHIAKSLVFYAKSDLRPVLIIVSGANRVDKEKVGEHLGFKIKTAGPEFVLETTGFPPGGVPPVAHKQQILTLIDESIMKFDVVWVAAGHPNSLFPISPADLHRLTSGTIISVTNSGTIES